jgi:hypothetical protein
MARNFRTLRLPLLAATFGAALLGLTDAATAGGTETHRASDFDDFDSGEVEGTAIEGNGRITRGFVHARSSVPDTDTAFSCYADSKGAVIGGSKGARLYTVKAQKGRTAGGEPKGPEVKELAKLDGAVVSAITRLSGGDLLAATLPGGQIYRVSAKGKVSEFAKLDVEAIWAMQVHKSRVLVATGPKGELFSLSLDGKDSKVILDTDEKHLLSLLTIQDEIVVGTAPGARLFQVTGKQEGELLHDFSGDEVRALAVAGDQLFAAVNDFESRSVGTLQSLSKSLSRASLGAKAPVSSNDLDTGSPKATASLWRVDLGKRLDLGRASEAAWDRWLKRSKQYFTDLAPSGLGVLVSASHEGKVYRVLSLRDRSAVADLEERKATGLCALPKGGPTFAIAGDGAAVYALEAATAKTAKYRSEVFDASQPAEYGALRILGRGKFSVRARTGPGEDPDERWTSWRPVKLQKDGPGWRAALGVTKRRYLQLEFTLESADAEIRDFEVFYAAENLAPLLTSVRVEPPEFDFDDDDEPDATSKIKWKADARDDDDLQYALRMRPEGSEGQWIPLNDGDTTTKKNYELELEGVPDGIYEVSVEVSDSPSNGSGRALTDELLSEPFVVDKTRPGLGKVTVKNGRVTGTATDKGSWVHDVALSVDGGSFEAASPADGIFDGSKEGFEAKLPDLTPGKHRVVVRVRDAHGNFVTRAIIVDR